jgi:hypothetical protein
MTLIDPITPDTISARIRESIQRERAALAQMTSSRALSVAPPEACPDELAGMIEQHNQAVAVFEARRQDSEDARIAFPLAMTDVSAAGVVEEAATLVQNRFEVLQAHLGLLGAKRPVLAAVVTLLSKRVDTAEGELIAARIKSEKAIRKAGANPADHPMRAAASDASKAVMLSCAVDATVPVRQAKDAFQQAKTNLDNAQVLLGNVDNDEMAVQQSLCIAWLALVGQAA